MGTIKAPLRKNILPNKKQEKENILIKPNKCKKRHRSQGRNYVCVSECTRAHTHTSVRMEAVNQIQVSNKKVIAFFSKQILFNK